MKSLVGRLFCEEDGATAIEYALLLAVIATATAIGAVVLGGGLKNMMCEAGGKMDAPEPIAPASAEQ